MKELEPARDHVVWIPHPDQRGGGCFVDASAAKVDVLDRGWLLGDGVFATMRGFGGRCFRVAEHLATLRDGAKMLGIELPAVLPAIAEIADAAALRTKAPRVRPRDRLSRRLRGHRPATHPARVRRPYRAQPVPLMAGAVGYVGYEADSPIYLGRSRRCGITHSWPAARPSPPLSRSLRGVRTER